jgi:hypothetical protein
MGTLIAISAGSRTKQRLRLLFILALVAYISNLFAPASVTMTSTGD